MTEKVDHYSGSSRSLDHVCVCVCVCVRLHISKTSRNLLYAAAIQEVMYFRFCALPLCLFIIERTAIAHFHRGSLEDATSVHVHYEETAFASAVVVTFANNCDRHGVMLNKNNMMFV